MEWNRTSIDPPRGTLPPEPTGKTWSTSRWWRGLLFACGSLYFIVTFVVTLEWSLWRETVTGGAALFSAGNIDRRTLAVVVPTHPGDLEDAVAALSSWPSVCSAITLHRMQLFLYYSGEAGDGVWSQGIIHALAKTGGRCFERTRVVFADLDEKDNVYPKAPSVMFYKMFLDENVARSFEDFDAFAILEWDVVVAHPTSFERLYKAAFFASEHFWVKGSTLTGAEFHETAGVSEMWHILGHLNGNAIYNTKDPDFKEFVNFTLSRWQYTYPYDVALWATIADFPYSWPLWQRYSSKFVATQLIANIGFQDVTQTAVGMAVSRDTLFIHGSTGGGGRTTNKAADRVKDRGTFIAPDCTTSACGMADTHGISDVSTFCDSSCLPDWSSTGPRFDGYGCGASDPARFGRSCRQCFTSQEAALAEEQKLSSRTGVHVVMCSTGNPPQASECSDECMSTADTVCDYRCGSRVDEKLHCNWRGLGRTCRFCFHDPFKAYLADETAKSQGSRVILCATHEPPVGIWSDSALAAVEVGGVSSDLSSPALPPGVVAEAPGVDIAAHAATPHSGDVSRGEMCAFMAGYFEFLPETKVAVSSVVNFMPGMKVGIATDPSNFHVFNRTLGHYSTVNVVNSSHVEHAPLNADKACGPGTRLILYMGIGEVLSRAFTEKDTHTPRGDLVVAFTDIASSHSECARRAMGISILLGFTPPCFTYGSDLILPAELNGQLRGMLRGNQALKQASVHQMSRKTAEEEEDLDEKLTGDLTSFGALHSQYATFFIPEVLAAWAFQRNPDSMVFINPKQWTMDNMFVHQSIWDVPLVKPRFGCSYDMSLSVLGYDVSEKVAEELESFKLGLKCERGFREIHPYELNIKTNQEFGILGALQDIPNLEDSRVSIMYRTFFGDAKLFEMSIQTVFKHFPKALEVVAVVVEEDKALFQDIMDRHRSSAPFPLRLVTEPDLMDGDVQQKYSKLRADLYTRGDHVLHLDSDVVLLEDITYTHIFQLGKPVLPYRRYSHETPAGLHAAMCWQNGTSYAVGEEVLHEYSIFNTHVYPRSMYPAARRYIEEYHQTSFVDFMSTRSGLCMQPLEMAKLTTEGINRMFSEFSFMGAYLWYHMHDAVYWVPADPWDTQSDQWRPFLGMYAWVCQANGRRAPHDEAGMKQYVADFHSVQNQRQCNIVNNQWLSPKMKYPATRTEIDRSSKEWLEG